MDIERKRVAVVITGHMRTFKMHFKDFTKRLLEIHDCDLYLSTWDWNIVGTMVGGTLTRYSHDEIHKQLSIYPNVKKIIISEYRTIENECKKYIHGYGEFGTCPDPLYKKYIGGRAELKTMPYNAGQWWPVQEGFRAIENPEQYDVLMRTRFDIVIQKPIRFLPDPIVACHPGPKYRPGTSIKQTSLYTIKNHVFYGTPYLKEVMKDIYTKNLEISCKFNDLATDSLLEYLLRNNDRGYELTVDDGLQEAVHYGVWK
jgi:hypothetical protein